jgi:hypothetical protein
MQVHIMKLCLRGKGWQESTPPVEETPAAPVKAPALIEQ